MKYIIGLGNPGEAYAHNRHNVGFMCIERLVLHLGIQDIFLYQKKFDAQIIKTSSVIFIKPMAFMNNSGKVARSVISYYDKHFSLDDITVIYDDLDLEIGTYKIQQGKSPKVHNGIADLRNHLGGDSFLNVRIGIDGRAGERTIPGSEYVLSNFSPKEREIVDDLFPRVCEEIEAEIEN